MELRQSSSVTAAGRRLTGYAARFDVETRIGDFFERIRPGAFRASLESGRDILALADHDASRVLGRTKSGTLELREDSAGLAFSLSMPDTQAGRDLIALAERGDLGGCSFAFTVPPGGEHWDGDHRELRSVNLHEISIVQSWPAYPDTSVALRHKNRPLLTLSTRRAWLETCR